MKTRSEAVTYLRALGYEAFERDWVMGQTIGVPAEPFETASGIRGWRRMLYLAPVGSQWEVHVMDRPQAGISGVSLKEACDFAVHYLKG